MNNAIALRIMIAFLFTLSINTQATQLLPIENCSALVSELKASTISDMETRLEINRQNALQETGLWCYESVLSPGIAEGDTATDDSATDYSETNVQVQGVDEADFVKNDGAYIYILAHGKFRIIDAWPPEESHEIATFDIEGEPKKMFVHEERAFIYSSLEPILQDYDPYYPIDNTECTYGYTCEFTGDGRELKLTILDLSEITHPSLLREMRFSGSYLNSRRIGNAIYSVIIFPEPHIERLQYWPDNVSYCGTVLSEVDITTAFNTLKTKNLDIIQAAPFQDWLPQMTDSQNNSTAFDTCDNFYRTEQEGTHFLSILALDNNGISPIVTNTIIGKPGAVYASPSALYIAAKHSQDNIQSSWFFPEDFQIEEASTLHKFKLTQDPPSSQYVASGVVKGRVLNQFSMDEFNGYFRIATTSGHLPNPNTHSTVSILEQQETQLTVIGKIDNIAPTEDIRSARFIGDTGYIVTFKKTDPLFVLDLSVPHAPKIAGELKIPGFSTYMHRIDDDHLLSIGYDADEQGNFAWFQGIMLQIFDVSDMTDPILTHKEVIGTRGSTSEAATNHLAFNYFSNQELLALPITICESSEPETGGSYGDLMTFSGLLVYKVNVDKGFDYRGGVSHSAPESQHTYWNACSNWWTQSNSSVKRSIFMDDYVFSITEDTIKVNQISALETDIAVIYLSEPVLQCDALHIESCVTEIECTSNNGVWETEGCHLPLYTPQRSSADLCTATYDLMTSALKIPCVNIANTQHNAAFSLETRDPLQLELSSVEPTSVRLASQGCEIIYQQDSNIIYVPCITPIGTSEVYWANFKVVDDSPFMMELTEFDLTDRI